ncbi:amidohydrolase [Nitriliruptoraceae bacterium ZYF776]|nr:amidohydrolase [Profundirhabdus halotolerans]
MTVVDFHTHLFPCGGADGEVLRPLAQRGLLHELAGAVMGEREITPDELVGFFRSQGVERSVVLAEVTPLTVGVSNNEFVGEFCAGVDALVPFCAPNPFIDRDLVVIVDALIARYGFRGVKIYPSYLPIAPNDSRLYPLYGYAQERCLPVMFHTGLSTFKGSRMRYADPLLLDDVAVDFPRLPIVMAHGGRDLWFREAFTLARIHSNVYLELSGLPPTRLLEYFPKLPELPGRVIFGTDFPVLRSIERNVAAIRDLGLSDAFTADVLGGTASRLLDGVLD